MKVQICNLGLIEKADIELKPLTVFIGCNGTGKTWTAYTLASILSKHGLDKYLKSYLEDKSQSLYPTIDNAIEQLLQEGNAQINILKFANDYTETYINQVTELAPTWMSSVMASERIRFEELKIRFNLLDLKTNLLEKIKNELIEIEISSSPYNQEPLLNVTKERGEEIIYFYTVSGGKMNILDKIPKRAVRRLLFEVVFSTIHRSLFSYVYPFPTERNTFIALNVIAKPKTMAIEKSLEEPEEQAIISRPKRGQQLIYPIQSFLTMMLNASLTNMEERENEIKQNPQILNYVQLAEFLEKNILQGNLEFEKSDFQNELLFQTTQGIKLEMPIVSSMLKELAPLVLYLRYLAKPDELLIIDEPEMNLHPAAQVEIIEFLAMLANAGLNILITTHSPYIVDHLANLIKAAKQEDKESIKERFYLEKAEAFISQEKVAVYLFEDGTARNILDEDGRIDWGTFSDVSEDISHIFP